MNKIDFDKKKFDKDSYGNLIPKNGLPAEDRYGRKKNVRPK